MKYKIVELDQNTDEWLEWRYGGIGASDASTIMGENRFKSPEELLHEKVNHIDEPQNEAMAEGKRLEPIARDEYQAETGNLVEAICIQSIEYPWIRASLDGFNEDKQYLVEIKCGRSAYKKAEYGEVPDYYMGQLQHQLMLTGLACLDYQCYWPQCPGILINVDRDDRYIKKLFKVENEFYSKMKKS